MITLDLLCARFTRLRLEDLQGWIADGQLAWEETVLDGVEKAPDAFIGLFSGGNTGKMLVRL
jgi:NADPH-dependent curcumin reductase CurA